MEPTRSPQATLNDLLDRILDKGIFLNADLIISVSGIPLIGLNLKLALAGVETMLQYGIMEDWDEAQRAIANKELKAKDVPIGKGEYITFSIFGTHWYSKGIYECWRAGIIYITNKRLIMFRKEPAEVLFEIPYEHIKAIAIKEKTYYTGIIRQELCLMLNDTEVISLHTNDTVSLKEAIESVIKTKGLSVEEDATFSDKRKVQGDFLQQEEVLIDEGNMWYLVSLNTNEGTKHQWKPGHLYLTEKRLCWWYDFDKKLLLDIPSDKFVYVTIEEMGFGNSLVGEKSLIIMYREENKNKVVCFSGDDISLQKWQKVIEQRISEKETEKNIETCPRCGKKADRDNLLKKGCSRCGWVSYRRI